MPQSHPDVKQNKRQAFRPAFWLKYEELFFGNVGFVFLYTKKLRLILRIGNR